MSRGKNKNGNTENGGEREKAPSRSAKKRESSALQKLGEELAAIPAGERAGLGLPEDLAEALDIHDRISDREGARRQRQYIGRLMRGIDAGAIERALNMRRNVRAAETARFHRAERLRDKLLDAGEKELAGLAADISREYGRQDEAQNLLELARKAREEKSLGARGGAKAPRAARLLFRKLAGLAAGGDS